MANTTAASLASLRGLTAKFDLGVQTASPLYQELCTMFPSKSADERYAALGSMPGVREWVGDRIFKDLRATDFTLANKHWENSLAVKKTDIADDRLGMYGPLLEQMGQEAALHPDQLFMEVLVAGESQACFDGQYFFDTDHSMGDSGSQSNDLTGAAATGTSPTEAEFRSAYHACRKAMLGFKRDNGKPFISNVIRPFPNLLLLVPTDMEEVADAAINKTFINNGESNHVLDKPRIMTSGALTNQDRFYLFNLSQPLKPFVFQAREPLSRQMKGMEDIEFKDVKFMTEARYNVGYLAWWNAVVYTFT